jgi:2-iminobutanoate/2-iminopropanoate deaminase
MKKIIHTTKAPKAIGPYSQATSFNEYIFCSGQIALDPETMEIKGETASQQAHQAIKNLSAVLEEAGSNFEKVLKTTLFLVNMDDFTAVNEVYGEYFAKNPPARSTVEVRRLPKGALVEVECIATL